MADTAWPLDLDASADSWPLDFDDNERQSVQANLARQTKLVERIKQGPYAVADDSMLPPADLPSAAPHRLFARGRCARESW